MPKCKGCGASFSGTQCPYCGMDVPLKPAARTVIHITRPAPENSRPISRVIPTQSGKSRWLAFLLCLFFGYFGFHCFYVRKTGICILYFFTAGLCGTGWLIDLVLIATGKYKDRNGLYLMR